MDPSGRIAFRDMVEARIAEWQKNIATLGQKIAKTRDDPEASEKLEALKGRMPLLEKKAREATEVPDESWPDFKSDADLVLENMGWLQSSILKRLG